MKPWKKKLAEPEPIAFEFQSNQHLVHCPFCLRDGTPTDAHHLVPKSLGGKDTLECCNACHKAIHALLPHKELRRYYHTVARLLEHKPFFDMVEWIKKQPFDSRISVDRPRDQKHRSKYR